MMITALIPAVILLSSLTLVMCSNIGGTRQDLKLDADGGYTDLLIAIHDNVPQDSKIISAVKREFRAASNFLLTASNGNLYFKDVSILVPQSWSKQSSWVKPTTEKQSTARIVVAPSNPTWGDTPYTLQPGLCGKEGDYIHLTPYYIKSKDPYIEKRLVREFAHLRWGVFDEDVPEQDTKSQRFYYKNGKVFPTKCTASVVGILADSTSSKKGCAFEATGLPNDRCKFLPLQETKATASLMFAENLGSVYQFCANDSSNEGNGDVTHDSLAPNRQNRICGQSVWSVMSRHSDFSTTHTRTTRSPSPSFKILHPDGVSSSATTTAPSWSATTAGADLIVNTSVITGGSGGRCEDEMVCLTLDVSGSMGTNDRIGKMQAAVASYIRNHLPNGTVVAVTEFESSAYELAGMTNITDSNVREDLISALPYYASGGTDIGAGMELCRQILTDYLGYDNTAGSRIMVLSDGEGSIGDLDPLVDQGIMVDTIAYSQDASPSLSLISDTTGGLKYFTGDDDAALELQGALLATIQRDCSSGITTLLNERVMIASSDTSVTQQFYIDSTLGEDTKLVFSYTVDINVTVTTPNNNGYTVTKDEDLNLITIAIHGEVTGLVTYTITRLNTNFDEDVTITITSKPVEGSDGIDVKFRTESSNVTFSPTTMVTAYVSAFQDLTPILGLNVRIAISRPEGKDVSILLLDRGFGPDSTPNDGIYTGMFSANQMAGDGYYSIRVFVSGEGSIPTSDSEELKRRKRSILSIGEIQRVVSGGYLAVGNFVNGSSDQIPPGRISDFSLTAALQVNQTFTVTWSMPGDDGFSMGFNSNGSELAYEFEFSNQANQGFTSIQFGVVTISPSLSLQVGDFMEAMIDAGQLNTTINSYFFRIRAWDEAGNSGQWSNVVSASFVDPSSLEFPVLVGSSNLTSDDPVLLMLEALLAALAAGSDAPLTSSTSLAPSYMSTIIPTHSTTAQSTETSTAQSTKTSTAQSTETSTAATTSSSPPNITNLGSSTSVWTTEAAPSTALQGQTLLLVGIMTAVWLVALVATVIAFYFIKTKFAKVHHGETAADMEAAYFNTEEEIASEPPRHIAFPKLKSVKLPKNRIKPLKL